MKKFIIMIFLCLWFFSINRLDVTAQVPNQPVVAQAVLFYSPSCPHCYQVITQDLPVIMEKFGEQLQIVGVNTYSEEGQALFQAAIEYFAVEPERQGVPFLVIGEQVLVGSEEIPTLLPGLVEQFLANGGVEYPEIPGLREAMQAAEAAAQATQAAQPAEVTAMETQAVQSDAPPLAATEPADFLASNPGEVNQAESLNQADTANSPGLVSDAVLSEEFESNNMVARLQRDPAGNALAIITLVGMLFVLGSVVTSLMRQDQPKVSKVQPVQLSIAIPILSIIGLGVAGYLAYIETTQSVAICGPVGDCNTVQQSKYAILFGVLPVGVLGILGYLAIILAWLVGRFGKGALAHWATLALFGMTLVGVVFSLYLTFLEPFVIGATCAWCVTSAIIMSILLWLAYKPAQAALVRSK